jgi:hypothetical protein
MGTDPGIMADAHRGRNVATSQGWPLNHARIVIKVSDVGVGANHHAVSDLDTVMTVNDRVAIDKDTLPQGEPSWS